MDDMNSLFSFEVYFHALMMMMKMTMMMMTLIVVMKVGLIVLAAAAAAAAAADDHLTIDTEIGHNCQFTVNIVPYSSRGQ